jgi:hypothetical protein
MDAIDYTSRFDTNVDDIGAVECGWVMECDCWCDTNVVVVVVDDDDDDKINNDKDDIDSDD